MTIASPALAGPHQHLEAQVRWRTIEIVFWLATLLPFVVTPDYLVLASQIAITALFALSLDLILGYAGIVSLGHAAFFGFGAYTAGLISKWGWGEPLTGLLAASIAASPTHPDALFVAFPSAVPPTDVICRLKSSDKTIRFLDEVETVMKARSKRAKTS